MAVVAFVLFKQAPLVVLHCTFRVSEVLFKYSCKARSAHKLKQTRANAHPDTVHMLLGCETGRNDSRTHPRWQNDRTVERLILNIISKICG